MKIKLLNADKIVKTSIERLGSSVINLFWYKIVFCTVYSLKIRKKKGKYNWLNKKL